MENKEPDEIVVAYLDRLDAALSQLPVEHRELLHAQIAEHIAEARAELAAGTEVTIAELLDRLGAPEEIAAEAMIATAASGEEAHAVAEAGGESPSAAGVFARIRSQVASVVIGKEEALEQLLIAVLCQGHALVEDVPGVGKTVLARALAATLGCSFRRIQFTPDVLPSDITGSSVFDQRAAEFEFRPGPVFTQVLLADEINRATPRAQSALLEAMGEGQVTVDGNTMTLSQPFLVLATQNPIELEGTFPLPEAQLDRFLLRVVMGYPTSEEEHRILQRFEHDNPLERISAVTSPQEIIALQRQRGTVTVADDVRGYLLDIVGMTRDDDRVALGASPRGALALHRAVQARAMLRGRSFALPDDVKALARSVLSHRVLLSAQARLRGASAEDVIDEIVSTAEVPVEGDLGAVEL